MLESQGFGVRLNLKTILLGILYASLSDLELAMSSLAVVGSTLNDQYIHSSLPFSSPADALLGSLFVKYKSTVPMVLFDDLLALFRHSDFQTDAVSFKKTEDILDHIALQRRMIARNRNQVRKPDQNTAQSFLAGYSRSSGLIPELLAEFVDSQRLPFHHHDLVPTLSHNQQLCEMSDMLVNMSLVHRTWTDAAQRRSRRRIHVDQSDMQDFLKSTKIGPWVRELSVRVRISRFERNSSATQVARLLSRILERCPNVTHLYLDNLVSRDADNAAPENISEELDGDVIARIANLEHLEYLWLRCISKMGDRIFKRICTVVPGLRRLKSLDVKRDRPMHYEDVFLVAEVEPNDTGISWLTDSDVFSPSASLECLSFAQLDFTTIGLLAGLSKPRNASNLKRLELYSHDCPMGDDGRLDVTHPYQEVLSHFLETGVAGVSVLQLIDCRNYRDTSLLLGYFPSLRTLRICAEGGFATTPFILPGSVRDFYLHFVLHDLSVDEQDEYVCTMLKSCPQVRRMILTYATDCPPREYFTNAIEYSLANGVEFDVEESITLPSILDL